MAIVLEVTGNTAATHIYPQEKQTVKQIDGREYRKVGYTTLPLGIFRRLYSGLLLIRTYFRSLYTSGLDKEIKKLSCEVWTGQRKTTRHYVPICQENSELIKATLQDIASKIENAEFLLELYHSAKVLVTVKHTDCQAQFREYLVLHTDSVFTRQDMVEKIQLIGQKLVGDYKIMSKTATAVHALVFVKSCETDDVYTALRTYTIRGVEKKEYLPINKLNAQAMYGVKLLYHHESGYPVEPIIADDQFIPGMHFTEEI